MKKVQIKGPIISNNNQWIYDIFDIEATSPSKVQDVLDEAAGEDVEVEINSGGGSVFDGSEIYTALKQHPGNVTVKIVGLAASAASVIAMAGKKVMMAPTAQMMIHNVSSISAGDYRDMEHTASILKNANKTIANAYILKSGMEQADLLAMMDKESWLTPEDALNYKLIDEVMFQNDAPDLVASISQDHTLPQEVIEKVRNMKSVFNPTEPRKEDNQSDILMAKFNLLKLKGDVEE